MREIERKELDWVSEMGESEREKGREKKLQRNIYILKERKKLK